MKDADIKKSRIRKCTSDISQAQAYSRNKMKLDSHLTGQSGANSNFSIHRAQRGA